MKRLLTLIGVVATLLLTPTNAKAWGDLYLLNTIWNKWGPKDTNDTYKFTKVNDSEFTYTLDASDYNGDIYWRINTPSDHNGKREIHPYQDHDEVGGNGYTAKYDESYEGKSFKIPHSTNNYTHYTITAKWDGSNWQLNFEGSGSKGTTQAVYLLGKINNWTGNSYKLEKDGDEYKLELTKAQVQDALHEGDFYFRFKEEMDNSKTYTVVPQNEQTALTVDGDYTSDTYATTKTDDSKKEYKWKFTPTGANKYFIYFKNENNTRKVRVATPPHDYYWVSPQVTNNQKWPYFKLTALRNRSGKFGDGKISDKYYTFTIKNDDLRRYDNTPINDGDRIDWYIARDDDAVWFRPSSDDQAPSESATSLNIGNAEGYDGYIGYRNFNGCKVYDANNTHKFAFNKGANSTKETDSDYKNTVKSYTFILNAKTSSDATKGNVYFNYAYNSSPVTSGDCYLLGNFKSASETEYVCAPGENKYPDNPYGPRKMTKYWYVGDTKYESQHTPCDSIVYEIKVNKPAAGWGNLYLDISPGSNTSWNKVYRPLISLGNKLDGRALIGGLTTAGANMDNNVGDQSLNPETSNDYTSYTFRFNATTYTYRLEFHTSLYLVGPGVSDSDKEDEKGKWDLSNVTSSDPRIRLKATQEKDHYRNLVYFTNGGQFRFIKNTDESATPNYKYTWYENDKKPKWTHVTTTNEEDYYPGDETQFRNNVQYENDASASNTAPKEDDDHQSMTFDLPSGWYYVNFYPNAATPYYTIEHSMELRDFKDVYYGTKGTGEERNVKGRNDYNFLRVWSDHIAWNKPDNIDVFVVSAFGHDASSHTTTATLTKLDVDYIPAKTGVILGCKLSKDNLTSGLVYDNAATLAWDKGEYVNYYNTLTAELTPYSVPSTSYTAVESKLIPLYEETELKRFSDETGIVTGEGYANYLFGFYRCKKYQQGYKGNDNDFQMGFWLTTGKGTTYANSAFLHLTKKQAEDLGVGTAYNTSSASAPAFMLLFDESDDNVITGISDITTAKGNSVAPQGWYTLQGVRTAKPTQRGIYIYNGKKVIVND